jgi:carbon starvation protein CstA
MKRKMLVLFLVAIVLAVAATSTALGRFSLSEFFKLTQDKTANVSALMERN